MFLYFSIVVVVVEVTNICFLFIFSFINKKKRYMLLLIDTHNGVHCGKMLKVKL